jgi:hypothetical protein
VNSTKPPRSRTCWNGVYSSGWPRLTWKSSPRGDLIKMLALAIAVERSAYNVDGALKLAAVDQFAPKMPENNQVSDLVKGLSPIDRDLLRTISVKYLKVIKMEAELATETVEQSGKYRVLYPQSDAETDELHG